MRANFQWQLRSRAMEFGPRTLVMGIVNVTPDSFSDGGAHGSTDAAIEHALHLLEEGADILDIGGESTRPGAPAATNDALPDAEEQDRVLPVIQGVLQARPQAVLSVDTYRSTTARLAIEAGAEIVNDVSGLMWDTAMARTVAELRCGLVLMHTRGLPSEWRQMPPLQKSEAAPMVFRGLWERTEEALGAGVTKESIVLDPGFGFGKFGRENWELLAAFHTLAQLGYPLLAGLSRKGFVMPALAPPQRDLATHAANTAVILGGAHLVRVHDVAGARQAASVADAVLAASD